MLVNVKIERSMTIALQGYSNIKPSISVETKDVPIEDYEEIYKRLTEIVGASFMLEVIEELELIDTLKKGISRADVNEVTKKLKTNIKKYNEIIGKNLEILSDV